MSRFILINTEDRLSYETTNPNNCEVGFYQYGLNQQDVAVSVDSVSFFNMEYPINSSNNVFNFTENGDPTVLTATLTPGAYTGSTLATELQTQLNAEGTNTFTVSYNTTTKKLTISCAGPDTFTIEDSTSLWYLGWFEAPTGDLSTFTADYPVNIAGYLYVDLELSNLPNGNMISSRVSNSVFQRIPITVGYGEMVNFQQLMPNNNTLICSENLHSLRIRLLNPYGDLYDLPKNQELSIVLRVDVI